MARRVLLAGLVVGVAWGARAHEADGCPPLGMLERPAARGALPAELIAHCLQEPRDDAREERQRRWLLWSHHLAADGPTEAILAEGRALAHDEPDPDRVVLASRRLSEPAPEAARELAELAVQRAPAWHSPVLRAQGVGQALRVLVETGGPEDRLRHAQGLAWLGVVGPPLQQARASCAEVADAARCATPADPGLPPLPPPDPDALVACADVGRAWADALWGRPFATQRDCVAEAAASLPQGEQAEIGARLALLLAGAHREGEAVPVVARRLAPVTAPDPVLAARLRALHAAADDEAGAAWWEAWGAGRPPGGAPAP